MNNNAPQPSAAQRLLALLPHSPQFPAIRRRPVELVYGRDDTVPLGDWIPLSLQHAVLALTFLIYPLLAADAADLPLAARQPLLTSSVIAIGLATMLQCSRSRFGSGYLLVSVPAPNAIPMASQALAMGGVGLLALCTLILGLSQVALSRIIRRLRVLLPTEVCGITMAMLGISLAGSGLQRAFGGYHAAFTIDPLPLLVTLTTLSIIVAITVFAPRHVKIYAIVAGGTCGWILARWIGVDSRDIGALIAPVSLVGLPSPPSLSFALEPNLAPLLMLVVITSLLDILSATISLEKLEDADWRRADMLAAERAVAGIGLANIAASMLAATPCGVSRTAVGFAASTGATARVIGFAAGALIFATAFFPKAVAFLTLIPGPVTGALLLYTACFMIVNGMALILTRRLNERRIFMVGLSVVAGVGAAIFPLAEQVPPWAAPVLATPIALGTSVALVLNLIFRIGIARDAKVDLGEDENIYQAVRRFLELQGNAWGTRTAMVEAAIPAVAQAAEFARDQQPAGPITLTARYDEARLSVTLLYEGAALAAPSRQPNPEALLGDAEEANMFTAFLLTRLCDRVQYGRRADRAFIDLSFDD
ncbi:purine/pyrimidine permease [Aquabacter sp. L1I39]|uniref:solute carrier family 23 protein n=1 Tax=Aquabacter sp. L1I39 TaxID=2820278 RepID=UPI001ADD5BB3|nr:solute carrier family 23 protein [Aquabacter sp. L1I39]QTL05937.1 purine/pyrimidine permease [Aquabacter sp. L1I39]